MNMVVLILNQKKNEVIFHLLYHGHLFFLAVFSQLASKDLAWGQFNKNDSVPVNLEKYYDFKT